MVGGSWSCAVIVAALLGGCARSRPQVMTSERNTLGEDEIEALRATTAYDIVARTHAEYLHSRGRESMDPNIPEIPAHVFIDDTYYGDISTLKTVPASQVAEVHFFQAFEAQYKFGSGHMGGVIQLITKR